MLLSTLSPLLLAILAPGMTRLFKNASGWIFALLPLGIFIYLAGRLPIILQGEVLRTSQNWIPGFKINLSFYLDGLSLLFALLISGIGALILIYAQGYLKEHPQLGRFYAYLLMFMASMLGVVLADNLITLFVFWELTSLSSYLLIGFLHEKQSSRDAALQALLVTGSGGLAMMAGFLLLGAVGNSLELSQLLNQGEVIKNHPYYLAILLTILAGTLTKSAQFPFHFWLPNAMEAPTPVSAYLHSATMVKAGIYLMARLNPILGGTEIWQLLLTLFGGTTMVIGAYLALHHTDLKRILAYSTISSLGILTLLIGIGSEYAIQGAMVYLLAHALFKGALFMCAGAVDHGTGTRFVTKLGGLKNKMPKITLITAVAALSLAGVVPLFGFIGKEMFLEALVHAPMWAFALTTFGVLTAVMTVTAAGMVGIEPFFGKAKSTPKEAHEAPPSLWLGPGLLAVLSLLFGLWPAGAQGLLAQASANISTVKHDLHLSLWHGINLTLLLSVLAISLGLLLYWQREVLRNKLAKLKFLFRFGPEAAYQWDLKFLNFVAKGQTRIIQNGYLRFYLFSILFLTLAWVAYPLFTQVKSFPAISWKHMSLYEWALGFLIIIGALTAVRAHTRLMAVISLGVVGYAVTLTYLLYGAPDLAMTQLLVETLTVILFMLVLYQLPRFTIFSNRTIRIRDAIFASFVGALFTILVWVDGSISPQKSLSEYFNEVSYLKAHGRNIVNVILVDFRGIDTLGEITVLTLAGLGVYALLKLKHEIKKESSS